MKIYWFAERGFIEIDGHELPGIAEVKYEPGKLDIHISIKIEAESYRIDTERIEHDN